MHKLKFEIISALQNSMCSTDKLVEVSNICDAYAELVEGQKPTTNSAIMQLLGRFLTLEAKWMDYAGPVAVFHELCAEARKLGATAQ